MILGAATEVLSRVENRASSMQMRSLLSADEWRALSWVEAIVLGRSMLKRRILLEMYCEVMERGMGSNDENRIYWREGRWSWWLVNISPTSIEIILLSVSLCRTSQKFGRSNITLLCRPDPRATKYVKISTIINLKMTNCALWPPDHQKQATLTTVATLHDHLKNYFRPPLTTGASNMSWRFVKSKWCS